MFSIRRSLTVLAGALFLLLPNPAVCQITNATAEQAPPILGAGHDYIHLLGETVSPGTGAVSIRIQGAIPNGRDLTVPFSIGYDSNSSLHTFVIAGVGWTDNSSYLGRGGWAYGIPSLTVFSGLRVVGPNGGPPGPGGNTPCHFFTNYVFTDLLGQAHSLVNIKIEDPQVVCQDGGFQSTTSDADFTLSALSAPGSVGQQFPPQLTLLDKVNGTVYHFPNSTLVRFGPNSSLASLPDWIETRNGNKITFSDQGGGAVAMTDTLGRPAMTSSGFGTSGNTITFPGLAPYTVTWQTRSNSWTFNPAVLPPPPQDAGGQCGSGAPVTTSGSQPEITQLTLSNGQSYTFQYESTYGLVSKVVYPSGAYVRYAWKNNPLSAFTIFPSTPTQAFPTVFDCEMRYDTPSLDNRFVSFDGVHEVLEQDFSYTTTWVPDPNNQGYQFWSTKTTTVVTKDLIRGSQSTIVYTYNGAFARRPVWSFSRSPAPETPLEKSIQYLDGSSALLKTVSKTFISEQLPPVDVNSTLQTGQTSETITCLLSSPAVPPPCPNTSARFAPQITDTFEYDYGPGASGPLLRHKHIDYVSNTSPLFSSDSFLTPSAIVTYDGSGARVAEVDYAYDQSPVAGVSNLPAGTHDETNYAPGSAAARGNATTVTHKCLQTCADSVTTFTYDETGQILTSTDSKGGVTQYSYLDSFDSPPSANTNAYLTQLTQPPTNGVAHLTKFKYAYSDGQLIQLTDENSHNTAFVYNDPLRRPTETDYPDGGKTTISYNDAGPSPSVTTSRLLNTSNQFVTSTVTMDGIGHAVKTLLTSDPDCASGGRRDTTYDGLGRVATVSNPYCTTSDPTYGLTTYAYDALGRTTQVAEPDGSTVLTSYAGRATQVQDEGNGTQRVQRISQSDALGRLLSVCEVSSTTLIGNGGTPSACGQDIAATGFLTTYQYDTLGNLLQVNQGTLAPRTFAYDSLARLTSASNPESGTITYSYDANGNLLTKTAPKQNQTNPATTVATTYQYDALNRLLSRSYNDGTTPTASFFYDKDPAGRSYTNIVGRLFETSVAVPPSVGGCIATLNQYDPMGRVSNQWQYTPTGCSGSSYGFPYTYDLLGNMTSSKAPYQEAYTYTYNTAGRLTSMTGSRNDAFTPANLLSAVHYNAAGQITSDTLGTGETESYTYTNRNQLQSKTATLNSSTIYSFNLTFAPDGNILTSNDSANGNWTYIYDPFNRLACSNLAANGTCASPTNGTPSYTYDYDRYGNRWHQNGQNTMMLSFSGNNNRMDGYSYDAAGNLLSDGTTSYTYDAENRLISATNSQHGTATYLYDADGRRVHRTGFFNDSCDGTGKRDYIYDLDGHWLVENNGGGTACNVEIYAGSRHLGSMYGETVFDHTDWLGTSRVRFDFYYKTTQTCTSLPFGDALSCHGSEGSSPIAFTGKERDSESNLDNFAARYDSSSLGRFISPDWSPDADPIPYADAGNPQTLNRYLFTGDNPLNSTDDDGHGSDEPNFAGTCGLFCRFLQWLFGSYAPDNPEITGSGTRNVVDAPIPGTNLTNGDLIRGTNELELRAAQGLQFMNSILDPTGVYANGVGCASGLQSCGDLGFNLGLSMIPGLAELARFPTISQLEKKAIAGVLKQIATATTKGKEYLNLTTQLPVKPAGYYREYTVPLPGILGKGESRLVTGAGGEIYYTAHHYFWLSFIRIK
jgi:RHS repeat-associated protein